MAEPEVKSKHRFRDFPSRYSDSLYQLELLKRRPEYRAFFKGWSTELYRVSLAAQEWNTRFPPHTGIFQGVADGMGLSGDKNDIMYWELMVDISKVIDPFLKECREQFGLRFMFPLARPSLEYLPKLFDPEKDTATIPRGILKILVPRLLHSFDSYWEWRERSDTWGREIPYSTYAAKQRRTDPDSDDIVIYDFYRMGLTFREISNGTGLGLSSVKDKYRTYVSYLHNGEEYKEDRKDKIVPSWVRESVKEICQECEGRCPGTYERRKDDGGTEIVTEIVDVPPDLSIGERCACQPIPLTDPNHQLAWSLPTYKEGGPSVGRREYRAYLASYRKNEFTRENDRRMAENISICPVIDLWVNQDFVSQADMYVSRAEIKQGKFYPLSVGCRYCHSSKIKKYDKTKKPKLREGITSEEKDTILAYAKTIEIKRVLRLDPEDQHRYRKIFSDRKHLPDPMATGGLKVECSVGNVVRRTPSTARGEGGEYFLPCNTAQDLATPSADLYTARPKSKKGGDEPSAPMSEADAWEDIGVRCPDCKDITYYSSNTRSASAPKIVHCVHCGYSAGVAPRVTKTWRKKRLNYTNPFFTGRVRGAAVKCYWPPPTG